MLKKDTSRGGVVRLSGNREADRACGMQMISMVFRAFVRELVGYRLAERW